MMRKLNMHIRFCRRTSAKYVRKTLGKDYTCQLCNSEYKELKDFKEHIFYEHDEMDVVAKYGYTIQKLI